MSSESYYTPTINELRRAELHAAWVEELRKQTQDYWALQVLMAETRLKNLKRKKDIKVETIKSNRIKQETEEWEFHDEEFHEVNRAFFCKIFEDQTEKIDFSGIFKEEVVKYHVNDLEIFAVRNKKELMKKRALLMEIAETQPTEIEIHEMVSDFFTQCNELLKEEKDEIAEYRLMLQEMGIGENEKCLDDIREDALLLKRKYYAWKEKEYIHKMLVEALKEEDIIYDGESNQDGIVKTEFCPGDSNDAVLQVTQSGTKRIMFEYVGVEDGVNTLSDEERKKLVNKGKENCKKINRVIERLQREYGIEMTLIRLQEPTLENMKMLQKKHKDVRKRDKQEQKRMNYDI